MRSSSSFCIRERSCSASSPLSSAVNRFYLAWLGEQAIGSVRLVWFGRRIYPTTIGIRPELQGRGYGRQMLSRLVDVLVAENWDEIVIEVETENRNALSLYRRCGFRETRAYGFYGVDV